LEASDHTIEISERVFEIQVAEDVFKKLQQEAASRHQPVPKIVDTILKDLDEDFSSVASQIGEQHSMWEQALEYEAKFRTPTDAAVEKFFYRPVGSYAAEGSNPLISRTTRFTSS